MRDRRLAQGGAISAWSRSRHRQGRLRSLLLGTFGLALLGVSAWQPWRPILVWNVSASAPLGLYGVASARGIQRGDLLLVQLPEAPRRLAAVRGYLPLNAALIKRIAALPGDWICALGDRVMLDSGEGIERLPSDRQGRPLPAWQGCRPLTEDEIFLLSDLPGSFDGRYFGPLPQSAVIGRLMPLWIR